jgi:hypothetical protein
MNESYVYTVLDAYGKRFWELKPPAGYYFTGEFRPPKDNDYFMTVGRQLSSGRLDTPRLIVKPQPEPIKATETTPFNYTVSVSIKDVYGKDFIDLNPPPGYEFTGVFEPPTEGREYLSIDGVAITYTDKSFFKASPRLRLRQSKKRIRVIFEPTGAVDYPSVDEWWISPNGSYVKGEFSERRVIHRRREEEF